MKVLFVVRHAKSSWRDSTLTDHDRPLNARGQRDAPRMGKRLAGRAARPDLIVSSSAVRALTTARIIAVELAYEPADIIVDESLYATDSSGMISVIKSSDDRHDRIMLVGHNPAVTDLVNQLANTAIDNVPTCGVAVLGISSDCWAAAGKGTATLMDFDFPKRAEA